MDKESPTQEIKRLEKKHELLPFEELPDDIKELLIESAPETYQEMRVSREQIRKIRRQMKRLTGGFQGNIAMVCAGRECPIIVSCPLNIANIDLPVGNECPVELKIVEKLNEEYEQAIRDILGLSETHVLDIITRNSVMELVEIDLNEIRMQGYIGTDGVLIDTPVLYNQKNGSVIYSITISPAFTIKEKLKKRKDTLLKQLAATEEMKLRYRKHTEEDEMVVVSKLAQKIAKIIEDKSINKDQPKVIEAEFKEVDNK